MNREASKTSHVSRINSNSSNRAMERYEKICDLGEGSQGKVFKCRSRDTGNIVAIKRYHELEEDSPVMQKMAFREIKSLKNLRHPNLLQLIEVFRRRGRLHLVLEYCEMTLLDVIEKSPNELSLSFAKDVIWQTLQGLSHCHLHNCIHRDVKPENILITKDNVVKLSDFGFARSYNQGDNLTDYVATRWYRAPELLVGDTQYGPKVDVWAVGCVLAEMLKGEALWPGKSDLDQVFLICKNLGDLIPRHMNIFTKNEFFLNLKIPNPGSIEPLENLFALDLIGEDGLDFLKKCVDKDPDCRPSCEELLTHPFLQDVNFYYPTKNGSDVQKKSGKLLPSLPSSTSGSPTPKPPAPHRLPYLPNIF